MGSHGGERRRYCVHLSLPEWGWRSHLISFIIIHTKFRRQSKTNGNREHCTAKSSDFCFNKWHQWLKWCLNVGVHVCCGQTQCQIIYQLNFLWIWVNLLSIGLDWSAKAKKRMRAVFYWGWSLGLIRLKLDRVTCTCRNIILFFCECGVKVAFILVTSAKVTV